MLSRIQSRKVSSRAFFEAVEQNNTSGLIDLVLSTHCDPKHIQNEQRQTLLHVACQLNHNDVIDIIRVLVEIYQCNPLLIDINSLTAYHYACLSGNLEVISYLFRSSDHHFITDYYPPPAMINLRSFTQSNYGKLITLASLSGSTEILRFLFHHMVHDPGMLTLKLSLYKDKLIVACKTSNCSILQRKHCWSQLHTTLYEVCCLDALKFFLDELTIESHSYSGPMLKYKGREKQVYASLLEIAYKLNDFETIQYLTVSKGIGPVQTTSHVLYDDRCITTSERLVKNDGYTNQVSPLHVAVRSGNTQIVRGLFSQDHHLYSDTDTLLHSACISGKKEMVEILIDNLNIEYCINARNINEDAPLHVACEWGHLEICLLLLEQKGCNIDATNSHGHTPLSLAVRHNRLKIFQTLLKKGAEILVVTNDTQETPLHFACCNISSQFASSLLESKTCTPEYLNARDKYGDTALFNACRIKNIEIVRKLISHSGCDRSFINDITKEITAHIACRINSLDILRVLVSEGLENPMQCNQLNHLNKSLLHLACENDAEDIIDYLIDNKICEQNNFDCCGRKPLHIACMRGSTRIVKKLLTSEKFKVTDKDKEDNTVLHYICNRDVIDPELILCLSSEISSMILEPNMYKFNPLHYLCANDGMQLLLCLLKHSSSHEALNAALYAPNGDADTPLHLAFIERRLELIKFFFSCCEMSDGLSKAICVQSLEKMNNVFHYALDYKFFLYNADGRKTSTSFAVTVIDLLLQAVNSNILEENIVLSLCQENSDQCTPIQYLIKKVGERDETSIELSILLSLWDSKLSPASKQKIFSVKTSSGNTLIHMAVETRCFNIIKFLVDKKICALTTCNKKGESPLHVACSNHYGEDTKIGMWLCEHGSDVNQKDNEGNTPLHVACAARNKYMVTLLLENDKCKSLNLQNESGQTPIYCAKDLDMIKYLIINGADYDPSDFSDHASIKHMVERLTKLKDENPLNPTVTVLVLGNSEAGKTTFIRSVTEAYNLEMIHQPSIGQIKPMEKEGGPTAGIEISEYRIFEKDGVRILFYDFAGHPEFESTHSVLLQNLLSLSTSSDSEGSTFLFLIIVDITKSDKLTQVMYWAKFIESCKSSFAMGKPEIMIIGSHVDIVLKDATSQKAENICKSVKDSLTTTMKSISLEIIENPILLNCCQPDLFDLQKVKAVLLIITKRLEECVRLDIGSHLLFVYLHVHFGDKPVKFSVLQKCLKEKTLSKFDFNELSFTRNALIDLLKGMHYRQHILLIGFKPNLPEVDFWILTAKAQSLMFQEINALLFSSNQFDRHIKIHSNVGVLPSIVLKKEFSHLIDYDLVLQFLEYSELCKKIDDTEILNLIEDRNTDSSGQLEGSSSNTHQSMTITNSSSHQCDEHIEYLFFPGLIKDTREKNIWKHNDDYSYTAGWSLECIENSFLSALFLQVLLLRLVFHFAATNSIDNKLHRECIIWKNGIFWSVEDVEMLVEVVNQNRAVNVLVRCFEDTELEAVKLRSAVLKEVFKVKEKHCPRTEVVEYIIRDPNFNDHCALNEPVQKVSMKKIVSAIIRGSLRVQDTLLQHHAIKTLLCFEPYVGIGDKQLTSLFDFDKATETLPEDFLSCVVDLQKQAGAQSRHTDLMMRQVNKPITYQDLRKLFDMHSVFHGRNPKDLL